MVKLWTITVKMSLLHTACYYSMRKYNDIHACMHACINTDTYIQTDGQTYIHACTHAYIHMHRFCCTAIYGIGLYAHVSIWTS